MKLAFGYIDVSESDMEARALLYDLCVQPMMDPVGDPVTVALPSGIRSLGAWIRGRCHNFA